MKQRVLPSAAVVFVVALLLRLIHIWQLRRSPFFEVLMGDAQSYHEWARRIAGGEWIGRDVFYQAPLYPYFLGVVYATIGESPLAVRVVQALLGSASCALLALAGRRFFSPPSSTPAASTRSATPSRLLSPRAGVAAGLGLAIYAPAIFFDGLIQKSVLDTFFISLSLWLLSRLVDEPHRRGVWLSLGAAMGALSLTRENALVFIAVIVAWCALRPIAKPEEPARRRGAAAVQKRPPTFRRAVALGAFVLGLAVVLMPVAIRNYAVGGGFYLTTSQFGPNFFIGNNPRSDGTYMSLRFGRGAPEYERIDATELAEHAIGRALTPAEVSSYWTDQALDFMTSRPGAWLKLMARKFLLLWNASEMLDTESQESYAEWSWPLRFGGWFGHFGVLVPLALLGAIIAWPERRRLAILYAMTGAYAASVLLFYVFARYRLPLVPLLMLFAGVAIMSIIDWIGATYGERRDRGERRATGKEGLPTSNHSGAESTRRKGASADVPVGFSAGSATSALIVVIVITAIFTNWPVLSKPLMRAITENNLATALQAAGRSDDAVAHYRRAIAIQPDYAPAYNNLGVVLRAQGQVDEAIGIYHQALSANGDYPDAHYNLANALLQENRAAEAEEHFRIALRSIPDSAGVRNNLGIALAASGRPDDAIAAFRAAVAAEPSSAKAHRNLGDSLTSAGHSEEGLAELRRALELDPTDVSTHYNLGSVLLEAGRFDEAITRFRSTLQLSPRSVEAHNNLGIALGSKGQIDAAIDEFQQALAIDPTFADARRNLTLATQARGQARGRR